METNQPTSAPGKSAKAPLHVAVVEGARGGGPLKWLQDMLFFMAFVCAISVVWVASSVALKRQIGAGQGSGSQAAVQGGATGTKEEKPSAFAPKEYSKETMPKGSVKHFADVKGCDEAKQEMQDLVAYLKDPAKFERLGGKLPKGVLLTGSPGTGKTLLARAVAGEAGVPFLYRAGSEFEEMYVGVGSKRVRSLFAAAKKKQPCIVFIDEIDAVGASRKHWESHTRKTLNQLLVEMDGFEPNENIVVIAATNVPETLDAALTRPGRFDRRIHVPNPDIGGRREILSHYLEDKPKDDTVNIETLARATAGFTGADLANLVNTAAVQGALEEEDKLTGHRLDWARDRIIMGSERKSAVLSEENRKLTAFHEGGHAVVALNTPGSQPVHKATITPRGSALGMVAQLPDRDETSVSKKELLARLDICMAGKLAEELVFGPDHVTTGASNDLQQATAIARHMVEECGMGSKVGPIYTSKDGSLRPSQETQRRIDSEVSDMLQSSQNRVASLLRRNMDDLHKVACALLERETLTGDEIRQLINHFPGPSYTLPEPSSRPAEELAL